MLSLILPAAVGCLIGVLLGESIIYALKGKEMDELTIQNSDWIRELFGRVHKLENKENKVKVVTFLQQ